MRLRTTLQFDEPVRQCTQTQWLHNEPSASLLSRVLSLPQSVKDHKLSQLENAFPNFSICQLTMSKLNMSEFKMQYDVYQYLPPVMLA